MRKIGLLFLCLGLVGSSSSGCTSDIAQNEENSSRPSSKADVAGSEDKTPAVLLFESNNGSTAKLLAGESISVSLGENATTGYSWSVVSTDRTFGYPIGDEYILPADREVGRGGRRVLTWSTQGPLDMTGRHTVTLEKKRGDEDAVEEYTFTVDVLGPEVRLFDGDDTTIADVLVGQDVVLSLAENATTGYRWMVSATDRSFAYPTSDEYILPADRPVGRGGRRVLTWRTAGSFQPLGTHRVTLELRRNRGEPALKTFSLTVNVTEDRLQAPADPTEPASLECGEPSGAECPEGYVCQDWWEDELPGRCVAGDELPTDE